MKILIVDDSDIFRGVVRSMLEEIALPDMEVWDANGGEAALPIIFNDDPDVVLCDVNMPNITGVVLLRLARARGSRARFGFLTSQEAKRVREVAAGLKVSFILNKPFTVDELRRNLLTRDRAAA